MAAPYTPTAFAAPIINPAVGGTGANPVPYISVSQYQFAPTAMDTSTLVQGGNAQAQTQSLADTIRRASRWADRYCFGADPAAKGASLAATLTVESAQVKVFRDGLRLVCDYKPILEVVGIDVGVDPSATSTVGAAVAAATRIGRRTIYVPVRSVTAGVAPASYDSAVTMDGSFANVAGPPDRYWDGTVYAVWSYVNGYPHNQLAADITADATSCQVTATDGAGGVYGVYPGSQLTVVDGIKTETVTVTSVTPGTATCTIGTTAFADAHTVPTAPDFLPVTAIPDDVALAVIFLTTSLIKTRGDNSLVLDEVREADQMHSSMGDVADDVAYAMELLDPFRIRVKGHN